MLRSCSHEAERLFPTKGPDAAAPVRSPAVRPPLPDRLARIRARIDAGEYDRPEVLDACMDRLFETVAGD